MRRKAINDRRALDRLKHQPRFPRSRNAAPTEIA